MTDPNPELIREYTAKAGYVWCADRPACGRDNLAAACPSCCSYGHIERNAK